MSELDLQPSRLRSHFRLRCWNFTDGGLHLPAGSSGRRRRRRRSRWEMLFLQRLLWGFPTLQELCRDTQTHEPALLFWDQPIRRKSALFPPNSLIQGGLRSTFAPDRPGGQMFGDGSPQDSSKTTMAKTQGLKQKPEKWNNNRCTDVYMLLH